MIDHFLESLAGVNGTPIMVLAIVAGVTYAIAMPVRALIHRFTPHPIDTERFEHDEE